MPPPHPTLRDASVLFADLRGFSSIAATCPPQMIFEVLNGSFARLSEVAHRHGGTIDKFVGDAIMVVFARGSRREHARSALHCAVDMQIAMDEANRTTRGEGAPELYLGIGVNTGQVIDCVLGSERYSARTVIGEEVNLAARIEAFCLRGQILVSESTHAAADGYAETGSAMEVHVKGRSTAVVLREVHALPAEGKRVPRQEHRRSPRVRARIPFAYHVLGNDVISQVRSAGTILDLGYRGVQVELDRPLGLLEEIKIDVELPLVGYRATDLYGRVVNVKRDASGACRYGVEFTSLGPETGRRLQALVHLLISRS